MFRFALLISAFIVSLSAPLLAVAQTVSTNQTDQDLQNSLMQEQSAICASYARIMEYSGLLEKTQGELWRERRFFAGALLRGSITSSTGTQPTNAEIDGVINEYSGWMLDLFSANPVIADGDKIAEKDKLRDYIGNFCTGLFVNADKAIAKVRPDLFATQVATVPLDAEAPVASPSAEQISRLLKENVRLQQSITTLQGKLAEQDKTIANQTEKLAVAKPAASSATAEPKASTAKASTDIKTDIIMGDTMDAPPPKPPLPRYLVAKDQEVITPGPTKDKKDIGLTQIQLASYSTIKNANNGLNILSKEMPKDKASVKLQVTATKLATGRNVFRVVSSPMPIDEAKSICSHYWSRQFACIIKTEPSS